MSFVLRERVWHDSSSLRRRQLICSIVQPRHLSPNGGRGMGCSGGRYGARSGDWGVVREQRGITIIYILFILIEKL